MDPTYLNSEELTALKMKSEKVTWYNLSIPHTDFRKVAIGEFIDGGKIYWNGERN